MRTELIFQLCKWSGANIVIHNESEIVTFEQELCKGVITLMTVFSTRLYGNLTIVCISMVCSFSAAMISLKLPMVISKGLSLGYCDTEYFLVQRFIFSCHA
jgi:hypothetical protein